MQFNPVSCKQSIGYAYRRQKYPGWSFLFPRSHIMALAKQVNFHSTGCWNGISLLKVCAFMDNLKQLLVQMPIWGIGKYWCFSCQKVIYNIQGEVVWYLLSYFIFFLNDIYLCETKLKAEEYARIFWEGSTQRHMLCSAEWFWPSPHPAPLQDFLGLICPLISYSTLQLLCP